LSYVNITLSNSVIDTSSSVNSAGTMYLGLLQVFTLSVAIRNVSMINVQSLLNNCALCVSLGVQAQNLTIALENVMYHLQIEQALNSASAVLRLLLATSSINISILMLGGKYIGLNDDSLIVAGINDASVDQGVVNVKARQLTFSYRDAAITDAASRAVTSFTCDTSFTLDPHRGCVCKSHPSFRFFLFYFFLCFVHLFVLV
jgi:hypothetical protein